MDREIYKKAKKKVKKKKEFYSHFTIYLACVFFFFVINFMTSQSHWWFIYPALGWGIGIVSHYFSAFGFPGNNLSEDWEERELFKEMRKLEGQKNIFDDAPTLPDEELELREFKKLRKDWDDKDFV